MANALTRTEAFDHASWTQDGVISVLANTNPAPGFAGRNAGLADTLADNSGAAVAEIFSDATVPDNAALWTFSLYIRKHPDAVRFPGIMLEFRGGTTKSAGMQINTATGEFANFTGTTIPTFSFADDVDPEWWRLRLTLGNNSTGNTTARVHVWPAMAASLGGGFDAPSTGLIVAWGANLRLFSEGTVYDPAPGYAIAPMAPLITQVGPTGRV